MQTLFAESTVTLRVMRLMRWTASAAPGGVAGVFAPSITRGNLFVTDGRALCWPQRDIVDTMRSDPMSFCFTSAPDSDEHPWQAAYMCFRAATSKHGAHKGSPAFS